MHQPLEEQRREAPRSAPEADVAHGLAGGAALCWRQVDLATWAHTDLVDGVTPGGLRGRRRVDAKWEVAQLNAAGVQENLGMSRSSVVTGSHRQKRAGSSECHNS